MSFGMDRRTDGRMQRRQYPMVAEGKMQLKYRLQNGVNFILASLSLIQLKTCVTPWISD